METQTQNNTSKGKFIVFEGIDGSGKSTQLQLLLQKLREKKINYYETREPTDSPIGSMIHQIMTGRITTDNKVIAALFVADRLDHLLNKTDGICEKINAGTTVISDRYYFSSYAYHSVDMDMDWVIQANSICADLLKPTCTVFIDTDPDEAMRRISNGRSKSELFETRERLILVREKYLEAINKQSESETVIIVNGNNDFHQVADDIWQKLHSYF
ncbi:MAG: dTMP kinase [Clostridiales bacterium]|jgi:dTMP kinase|nr:dTMP kinase [Clostridiales bacterium]